MIVDATNEVQNGGEMIAAIDGDDAEVESVLILDQAGSAPDEFLVRVSGSPDGGYKWPYAFPIIDGRTSLARLDVGLRKRLLQDLGVWCHEPISGCDFLWMILFDDEARRLEFWSLSACNCQGVACMGSDRSCHSQ